MFLIYKAVWKYITISLGIGTELYDDMEEENRVIESQHETWNYNTGETTVSTTRTKGNQSITVVGKAKLRKRLK